MSPEENFIAELPAVFTVKTFGTWFHFDQKTVYRMVDEGELACLRRPGKSIRILKHQVIDWVGRMQCDSSKSEDGETGTSDGQRTAAAKSQVRARRIEAKLNATSKTSGAR